MGEVKDIHKIIMQLATQTLLNEVDADDVEDVLVSDSEELTNEELIQLDAITFGQDYVVHGIMLVLILSLEL